MLSVQAHHVADRVVHDLVGVDPGGDREILFPQPEALTARHLDPTAMAVEPARLQVDAMIDAVVAAMSQNRNDGDRGDGACMAEESSGKSAF